MTAYTAFGTTTSNTAAPVFTLAGADTLFVADAGVVANTNTGHAIRVTGDQTHIDILGDVYAAANQTIHVEDTASATTVWIGQNGSVIGNPGFGNDGAINILGSSTSIINHGQIAGNYRGISSDGSATMVTNFGTIDSVTAISLEGVFSQLVNHGTIRGGDIGNVSGGSAVSILGNGSVFTNYGTVLSTSGTAITLSTATGETTTAYNYGTVQAGPTGASINGSSGQEEVTNAGALLGRVTLGFGNDTFNNTGGGVAGTVFLGVGDDLFVTDTSNATGIELVDGDEGGDTIDFSNGTAAVWVHLSYNGYQAFTSGTTIATNANATTALARLTSIENVIGSGGSDIVHGNAADNAYFYTGHHGATIDQFFGYDGSDTFDASYLGDIGSAVWVDLTLAGTDAWMSGQETATNANASIQIAALDAVENVVGTLFSDRILGSGADNTYFYNGNDATGPGPGPEDFFDARGGSDTIDFSLSPHSVWVSLAVAGVEAWSSLGAASNDANANERIADLVSVENAVGSAFSDTIRGSSGDNRLDGFGTQNAAAIEDVLLGLGGNDTFAYGNGYFQARIGDFVAGGTFDGIELSGFGSAFNTFAEVIAAATQVGTDVEIDFGDGDILTLSNVTLGNLTAGDFTFV